jgi:hypothetical protein
MRTKLLELAVACVALASACSAPPFQNAPRPNETGPVAADRARVYLARSDDAKDMFRAVRIIEDGVVIGRIGGDEYLCWDRPLTMGVGQAFYEALDPGYGDVENVFELPRGGGTTTWLVVRLGKLRKPEIAPLSPEEGRALIAKRKPAPTN